MIKQNFIDKLSDNTGNLSVEDKIKVCEYYLAEYVGLHVKINGGTSGLIDYAFAQLQRRIKEFL